MFVYVPQVHMPRTKIHHHGLKTQHIHHQTPIKTHQHFGIATCIYIYIYVCIYIDIYIDISMYHLSSSIMLTWLLQHFHLA